MSMERANARFEMKERPILFSAKMVRAILDGRKTQTRRAVKPQPWRSLGVLMWGAKHRGMWFGINGADIPPGLLARCPYGVPGDRLWVRETWQAFFVDEMPADRPRGPEHTLGIPAQPDRKSAVFYRADGEAFRRDDGTPARWKSPLCLPRKYSRILLEVTAVRVEQLRAISRGDAMSEGRPVQNMANGDDPRERHRMIWDQIDGPESWGITPWVWVVEFKRVA